MCEIKIGVDRKAAKGERTTVVFLRQEDDGPDVIIGELRGEAADHVDGLDHDSRVLAREMEKIHKFQHGHDGRRVDDAKWWGRNIVDWIIYYAALLEAPSKGPLYMKQKIGDLEALLLQQNAEISTLRRLIGEDKLDLANSVKDMLKEKGLLRELAGYIVFLEGYWAPKMSAEVSRNRYQLSEEAVKQLKEE